VKEYTSRKERDHDAALIQKCLTERWEPVLYDGVELRNTRCALCDEYNAGDGDCGGCPIYAKTGRERCSDTPFYDFHTTDPSTALPEVRFLRQLLKDTEAAPIGKPKPEGVIARPGMMVELNGTSQKRVVISRAAYKRMRTNKEPLRHDIFPAVNTANGKPWECGLNLYKTLDGTPIIGYEDDE
jgi:hypothetical protein